MWVIGAGHWVEVATGRGQSTEINFSEMIPTTNQTQQEHIDSWLKTHVEDSVRAEIREGSIPYGRWETTYRTKYRWSPAMSHQADEFSPLTVEMNYFNGEQDVKFYDLLQVENDPRKPVSTYFRLEWRDVRENLYAARVYFDEAEIFGAFE